MILGDDTDASNVSFSRFNSVLGNKNEAFLNGEEDMSKKMLLEDSSDGEYRIIFDFALE